MKSWSSLSQLGVILVKFVSGVHKGFLQMMYFLGLMKTKAFMEIQISLDIPENAVSDLWEIRCTSRGIIYALKNTIPHFISL